MGTKVSLEVWTTPELTIMVRANPEEMILSARKKLNQLPGAGGAQNGCYFATCLTNFSDWEGS
jgi:hypothetical protein